MLLHNPNSELGTTHELLLPRSGTAAGLIALLQQFPSEHVVSFAVEAPPVPFIEPELEIVQEVPIEPVEVQPDPLPEILSYPFYPLRINLITQGVKVGRKLFVPTPKQYGILAYLAQRPDEIVRQGDIYENVWEQRYDGGVHTVEQHLSMLRKRIITETRITQDPIQTVPRRGVVFNSMMN